MTKIIKQVTLNEIKTSQDSGITEVDIASFTLKLQSAIIINISVGTANSDVQLDYENDDGTIDRISLTGVMSRLFSFTVNRIFHLHNIMFPQFIGCAYMPSDWRYKRNVQRFRGAL